MFAFQGLNVLARGFRVGEEDQTRPPGDGDKALRVLIVEDEALVAMLLEDMVVDFGCTVAGVANSVDQALTLIEAARVNFAILDVNLAGKPSFPLAEELALRGTPFAFATGYGAAGLPEIWRDRPTLQKPYSTADVERILAQAKAAA